MLGEAKRLLCLQNCSILQELLTKQNMMMEDHLKLEKYPKLMESQQIFRKA